MKIAVIYPFPAPVGGNIAKLPSGLVTGGGETYPLNFALELGKRGHSVTYFTGKFEGIKDDAINVSSNLKIVYLPLSFANSVSKAFSFQLVKGLLLGKYDVIYSAQLPTFFTLLGGIISKILRIKCVVGHHGFLPKLSKKYLLLAKINSLLINKLIVQSEYSKKFYDGIIAENKIFVSSLGIDIQRFKQVVSIADVKERLNLGQEKVICYVGRLLPSKGIDTLLKAFSILIEKNIGSKLVIVGKGGFEDYLRKLAVDLNIQKHVLFVGFVEDEDLPKYYALSDVFVLPSVYTDCFGNYNAEPEAFGLVLAEAMACRTPVVASRVGGVPYWIKDGFNGLLFKPGDVAELSQKIESLLRDNELRDRLVNQASEELEKQY